MVEYTGPSSGGGHAGVAPGMRKSGPGGAGRGEGGGLSGSAANRLIGEVVQSRRRPLLGPSPG